MIGINKHYPAYKAKMELRNRQRREAERLLLEKKDQHKPDTKSRQEQIDEMVGS